MNVRIKLFATLGRFSGHNLPGTPFELDLPDGATLQDLVDLLCLPAEEVKVCFVNGIVRDIQFSLSTGDDIGIFPPIGGG